MVGSHQLQQKCCGYVPLRSISKMPHPGAPWPAPRSQPPEKERVEGPTKCGFPIHQYWRETRGTLFPSLLPNPMFPGHRGSRSGFLCS